MKLSQTILKTGAKIFGQGLAQAHCDVPCGIYDPHGAIVAALTVIRMVDIMEDFEKNHPEPKLEFLNTIARAVKVKEEHAEICKREIRVIWGDYFKQEHLDKYPEVPGLVHEIMQLASKARQTVDRSQGEQLLEKVNRFAEIFWETKSLTTKRVKAPYKPEAEIVVPNL